MHTDMAEENFFQYKQTIIITKFRIMNDYISR